MDENAPDNTPTGEPRVSTPAETQPKPVVEIQLGPEAFQSPRAVGPVPEPGPPWWLKLRWVLYVILWLVCFQVGARGFRSRFHHTAFSSGFTQATDELNASGAWPLPEAAAGEYAGISRKVGIEPEKLVSPNDWYVARFVFPDDSVAADTGEDASVPDTVRSVRIRIISSLTTGRMYYLTRQGGLTFRDR